MLVCRKVGKETRWVLVCYQQLSCKKVSIPAPPSGRIWKKRLQDWSLGSVWVFKWHGCFLHCLLQTTSSQTRPEGFPLSIPLWSIAVSSSTNLPAPCLWCLQVHLPLHRTKTTLQVWVCTSVLFMSFKPSYSPSLHSQLSPGAPISVVGEVSPGSDVW